VKMTTNESHAGNSDFVPYEESGNKIIPRDEHGHPLDPPLLLVTDIVRMKLLKGVKARRVQQMIEEGVLPARKATKGEELTLLKNGRARSLTVRGIYVIEPAAVEHARRHRRPVGFPKGASRPRRGTLSKVSPD
jgi:hypothetical protein